MILHKISTIVNITKNNKEYGIKWYCNLRTIQGGPIGRGLDYYVPHFVTNKNSWTR